MDPPNQLPLRLFFNGGERFHHSDQSRKMPATLDRIAGISSVFEGVLIARRCARGPAPVHPATAVRHRWRLALQTAPCPRSTSAAQMHGQFALHGVVPWVSSDALPPGRCSTVPTTACPPE